MVPMQGSGNNTRGPRGNGTLAPFQTATGDWRIKIPTGLTRNGRMVYFSPRGETPQEVLSKVKTWRQDFPDPSATPTRKAGQTLSMWLDHWLATEVKRPGGLSAGVAWKYQETTLANYQGTVERHVKPFIGEVRLKDLRPEDLDRWIATLQRTGRGVETIRMAVKCVRAAVKSAVRQPALSGLRRAVDLSVELPQRAAKPKYNSDKAAINALIAAANDDERLPAFIPVTLALGGRKGELLGLQWADVDFDLGVVVLRRRVSRSGGRVYARPGTKMHDGVDQTVPLPLAQSAIWALRRQQKALRAYRDKVGREWVGPSDPCAPDAWVFPARDGGMHDPSRLDYWYATMLKKAGVAHKTVHSLRHDCATYLLNQGVPVPEVSELLRHSNPSITLGIYSHVVKGYETRVASVMDGLFDQAVS